MGTSQSSSGPPSGVPLVPPWVPDAAPAGDNDDHVPPPPNDQAPPKPTLPPGKLAPSGRFGPARTSLGNFARTGFSNDMRRGVGSYVRKGLGGAATAVRRFGGTARTAGALYGALTTAAAGQAAGPGSPLDPTLLAGHSADEIMDAVVEAVRPVDGTQDAEASRSSIHDALSELLKRFPKADLLNLSEEERLFAIERYIAFDVYKRFSLDVGKAVQEKAPSITMALQRLREVKDYIKETVSASFRKVRAAGHTLNARQIVQTARTALQEAFKVFEDYL